jgi:hypothetical protein
MGYFFFDESLHRRGGFILGAYVYCPSSPAPAVDEALSASGLTPGIDEYKSGASMLSDVGRRQLREALYDVLHGRRCRIGVMVHPFNERQSLGPEALQGLSFILKKNQLDRRRHRVWLDEGLFGRSPDALEQASKLGLDSSCELHFEQDSRKIAGLQLADLTAHALATMLLAELGLVSKLVKAGPDSGYDPDIDLELEFELWARLRYLFFQGETGPLPEDPPESSLWWSDVASYGLHVSAACSKLLREAALARFGRNYLGCIH